MCQDLLHVFDDAEDRFQHVLLHLRQGRGVEVVGEWEAAREAEVGAASPWAGPFLRAATLQRLVAR